MPDVRIVVKIHAASPLADALAAVPPRHRAGIAREALARYLAVGGQRPEPAPVPARRASPPRSIPPATADDDAWSRMVSAFGAGEWGGVGSR